MARQQWEYCEVSSPLLDPARFVYGPAEVQFYTTEGISHHPLSKEQEHLAGRDNRERLTAWLGKMGWELVGVENRVLYFKRPLDESDTGRQGATVSREDDKSTP